MKVSMKGLVLASSMFIASITSTGASAEQETITYKNSRGSILELRFKEKNVLKGTFISAVAAKDCQEIIGLKRPLRGYVDNSALTFIIHFPTCGSVVSLTGHIDANREKISTIAIIARQSETLPEAIGTQFITQDTFVKVDKGSE